MHSEEKALDPTEEIWIRMWNKAWASLHSPTGFKVSDSRLSQEDS